MGLIRTPPPSPASAPRRAAPVTASRYAELLQKFAAAPIKNLCPHCGCCTPRDGVCALYGRLVVCAWCADAASQTPPGRRGVTHGLCPACAATVDHDPADREDLI
jgi:hypothetical protein